MPISIIKRHIASIMVAVCSFQSPVFASHLFGGGFTYKYMGDTIILGQKKLKYSVKLTLYQDCLSGAPEAIAEDNPAFFTLFEAGAGKSLKSDSVSYIKTGSAGPTIMPVESGNSLCGATSADDLPSGCLLRKTFEKIYCLDPNSVGYTIAYQRCCRNAKIVNIVDAGNRGVTYYCDIPPQTVTNTSAEFKSYPPTVICNSAIMNFDHSATDDDGDSLSYELDKVYVGAETNNIKPYTSSPPPYETNDYMAPYTYDHPMDGTEPLQIDAVTGKLSVTPNRTGTYLISVLVKEWRNGAVINITRREFQWTVTDCNSFVNAFYPKAGVNKTVLVGESLQFHATGSTRYMWTPGTFLNNPYIADPVGVFTEPGEYTYILLGKNDAGCNGSDTVKITVLGHSEFAVPNAFTPNNDGKNDLLIPLAVGNSTLNTFRVYNRYGNLLYETRNSGNGWDGRYKTILQDLGSYMWQVEYTDNSGRPRVKSGNVILLR